MTNEARAMMHRWMCGSILPSVTISLILTAATQAAEAPTLSQFEASTVRLEVQKFAFTSGMHLNEQGKPDGKGTSIVSLPPQCGSGFVVSADGNVATSYLVAQRAISVLAVFEDGGRYPIDTILAFDSQADLAVLKMTPTTNLASVDLDDSDTVGLLERVFAAGNPLCEGLAVTDGRVNRVVKTGSGNVQLIRHSAASAPGSYGGPVYREGKVVGVQSYSDMPYEMHYATAVNILKALLKKPAPESIASVFDLRSENISKRRVHVFSVSGTVAPSLGDQQGLAHYRVDLPWRQMDVEIAVEADKGQDVAVVVTNTEGEYIGYGNEATSNSETLYLSFDQPQPIAVHVLNLGTSETRFGLTAYWIRW